MAIESVAVTRWSLAKCRIATRGKNVLNV